MKQKIFQVQVNWQWNKLYISGWSTSNQKEMKQKIPGKCLFIKRDDNETLTRDTTLVKIKYNLQW